jgi:hypothetical protein
VSATTIIVFEVTTTDLLRLRKSDDLAQKLGKDYCSCMLEKFDLKKEGEVDPVFLRELGMVELDGPWESVCWVGSSTLTIGTGVKWGVFLTDSIERASVLREMVCLASSFQSSEIFCFCSSSAAYDLATNGASVLAIKEKLRSELVCKHIDFFFDDDITSLIDEIGAVKVDLERFFFEMRVVPSTPFRRVRPA